MITVSNLTKSFHKQPPLWENLSFDVPPHSITALTGPSGSGKSTLLNCIGALETPDSGSIQVFGSPKIPTRLCGLPLSRLRPHPRPNRLR